MMVKNFPEVMRAVKCTDHSSSRRINMFLNRHTHKMLKTKKKILKNREKDRVRRKKNKVKTEKVHMIFSLANYRQY